MTVSGKTDIGVVRDTNQDSFLCDMLSDEIAVAVVCDGMGGANGGEVASSVAAREIFEALKSGIRKDLSERSAHLLFKTAIFNANMAVFKKSREDKSLSGMGTTAVAAITSPDTFYFAHVGDSRIYLANENGLKPLTKDHSVVQSLVENGQLTEQEALSYPNRNVITRAVGVREDIDVDFNISPRSDGDILLLCTDGLTNFVDDGNIYQIITGNEPETALRLLINSANNNGGKDNITAVIIK